MGVEWMTEPPKEELDPVEGCTVMLMSTEGEVMCGYPRAAHDTMDHDFEAPLPAVPTGRAADLPSPPLADFGRDFEPSPALRFTVGHMVRVNDPDVFIKLDNNGVFNLAAIAALEERVIRHDGVEITTTSVYLGSRIHPIVVEKSLDSVLALIVAAAKLSE